MDRVFLRYIESARFHLAITTDVSLRRLKNKEKYATQEIHASINPSFFILIYLSLVPSSIIIFNIIIQVYIYIYV